MQSIFFIAAIEEAVVIDTVDVTKDCIILNLTVSNFFECFASQLCICHVLTNVLCKMHRSLFLWTVHLQVWAFWLSVCPTESKFRLPPMTSESATVCTPDKTSFPFEALLCLPSLTFGFPSSTAFTPKPAAFMADQRLVEEDLTGFLVITDLTVSLRI